MFRGESQLIDARSINDASRLSGSPGDNVRSKNHVVVAV